MPDSASVAHNAWSRIRAPLLKLRGSLRFTGWFALLSFFCIGLVSVASSILLSRFLTTNLLEHDAATMMEVVQSLVDVQDTSAYFVQGNSPPRDQRFEEFLAHVARLPDVLRANIYDRDQRVLWSSDPALIGRKLGPNAELEEALEGHIEIESGVISPSDPKPEHLRLSSREPRFVENYLPVRAARDRPVIGVVELYRVPTALFEATQRGVRLIWMSAILGGALLYLVLYGLVRRADRLLEEQSVRLLESETLAVIGEMTGAITHGIRNPLASIRSSAELLHDEPSTEVRGAAQDIMSEVDRLSEWVRQLLTYSDQAPASLSPVDVPGVLHGCIEGYARELHRCGIEVDMQVAEAVPPARAEVLRLTHVFNSLIANALEAMPSGGALAVNVSVTTGGRDVEVRMRDTGSGIAAEALPRIFAPFFTTKRKGLGLGLPLVNRIITRFGGSVTLTSNPGDGALVTIRLCAVAS
ncbi:MAG: ATP-binding protein [Pseudomonadota bacterium]|nr:ATP-binding protein [Pseudomonadota bacterium]